MSAVTFVSMAIPVNGTLGKKFKPTRGLRQGDPLSPFLFLFINDVLSRMIKKLCSQNLLDTIHLGHNSPLVSNLFFADDSIFFFKATSYNGTDLNDSLNLYFGASGQSINLQKSSIYFSPNTTTQLSDQISSTLHIQMNQEPGPYLGLPV
ncbi:hypothetical protein ACLB2K_026335 [Fragaria x ananassa]